MRTCVSLRRFLRLWTCVWGAALWHHLPWGVSRGQDNHELPSTSQPTCHIQVTYASNHSCWVSLLFVAEHASLSAHLNFCSVAVGFTKYYYSFHMAHHYLGVRSLIMPVWSSSSISLSWSHGSSPPSLWPTNVDYLLTHLISIRVLTLTAPHIKPLLYPCPSQHPSSLIQFSPSSPLSYIHSILTCPKIQRPFAEGDWASLAHFLLSWHHFKSTHRVGSQNRWIDINKYLYKKPQHSTSMDRLIQI